MISIIHSLSPSLEYKFLEGRESYLVMYPNCPEVPDT